MVRTNMTATRVKPAAARLLTMHVLRRTRLSPTFMRVTVGGHEVERFAPMGFDQWFRLFLPVGEDSLARLPSKLDTLSYLRYLAIAKTERPLLRNYTVADFRADGADGAELDIDFVLHGGDAAGAAGPAADWAQTCAPGDAIGVLDEGVAFNPPAECADRVMLVADESALPAAAGILASLPRHVHGHAVLEVADAADRRELDAPDDIEVQWIVRTDAHATPGQAARAAASTLPVPESTYCWAAGEQALAVGLRRHWVHTGVPKGHISFTGYWRAHA